MSVNRCQCSCSENSSATCCAWSSLLAIECALLVRLVHWILTFANLQYVNNLPRALFGIESLIEDGSAGRLVSGVACHRSTRVTSAAIALSVKPYAGPDFVWF